MKYQQFECHRSNVTILSRTWLRSSTVYRFINAARRIVSDSDEFYCRFHFPHELQESASVRTDVRLSRDSVPDSCFKHLVYTYSSSYLHSLEGNVIRLKRWSCRWNCTNVRQVRYIGHRAWLSTATSDIKGEWSLNPVNAYKSFIELWLIGQIQGQSWYVASTLDGLSRMGVDNLSTGPAAYRRRCVGTASDHSIKAATNQNILMMLQRMAYAVEFGCTMPYSR